MLFWNFFDAASRWKLQLEVCPVLLGWSDGTGLLQLRLPNTHLRLLWVSAELSRWPAGWQERSTSNSFRGAAPSRYLFFHGRRWVTYAAYASTL